MRRFPSVRRSFLGSFSFRFGSCFGLLSLSLSLAWGCSFGASSCPALSLGLLSSFSSLSGFSGWLVPSSRFSLSRGSLVGRFVASLPLVLCAWLGPSSFVLFLLALSFIRVFPASSPSLAPSFVPGSWYLGSLLGRSAWFLGSFCSLVGSFPEVLLLAGARCLSASAWSCRLPVFFFQSCFLCRRGWVHC